MRRIILILIFGMLLLNIVLVAANEGHESGIEEGEKLVESGISCDKLTDEQLEAIGDYYMEQMHPGEAHEMMHEMMGGHDSETTKLMHINMAKGIYCDEDVDMMGCGMMGGGMMDSGNMMDGNMMGNGMMSNNMMSGMMSGGMMGGQTPQTSMMRGMTGNFGYLGYKNGYWNFLNVLYITLLIALIILVFLFIAKLLIYKKN